MATSEKVPAKWTRKKVLIISLAARLILVFYSNIHDYIFKVNFTDVDYQVFSDAARHVSEGRSPFDRATYRYTPALAWILLPVCSVPDFGKVLFCVLDIVVGWLCFQLIDEDVVSRNSKDKDEEEAGKIAAVVIFWLANPLTAVVSARGNADVLVCLAVLYTLHLLRTGSVFWAAFVYGVCAIHLKIYPIIYLPSIFLYLCDFSKAVSIFDIKRMLTNVNGIIFAFISLISFAVVVCGFYHVYGDQFLDEFLLYHIRRRDLRHNFSPYFYLLYLFENREMESRIIGFTAFVPQMLSILYFAFRFSNDLPFCWFLTTFAFVSFNKVCTSQYFVWYLVFLPIIATRIQMDRKKVVALIASWFSGHGLWLLPAYFFEFKGMAVFEYIWLASLIFLLINCYIMRSLCQSYAGFINVSQVDKQKVK